MKIGYDAKRLFHNNTGLGHYSRTLVKDINRFGIDHELFLFAPNIYKSDYEDDFRSNQFNCIDLGKLGNAKRVLGYKHLLEERKIDIFHGLSNELPHNIHRLNIPSVVTIHDVIFKVLPDTYSSFDRAIYNYKTKYACKSADIIVAISESTKRDIIRYYDVDENKIKVIYQTCHNRFKGGREHFIQPNINSHPEEYFIQVGSINERKNLLNTLKALALIKPDERPHLVVVGRGNGDYYNSVIHFIQKNELEEHVHMYNDVADEELPYLYHHAKCSIYISNYEGFGIPVIESLYCGTSVITSNVSSMPEAAGPCGLLVDPTNVEEIKDALLNPPGHIEKNCQEFLERFESKQIIGQWMRLYEELHR